MISCARYSVVRWFFNIACAGFALGIYTVDDASELLGMIVLFRFVVLSLFLCF